jgi:hypothetical protein
LLRLSQNIAGTVGGYNYLQWARTARQWEKQKIELRGTDEVRKLTEGFLGAFEALSSRLDAQDEKMQKIDERLQCLEGGMNAILQRLQAPLPVNQPAPCPVDGEEAKVGEEERGKI